MVDIKLSEKEEIAHVNCAENDDCKLWDRWFATVVYFGDKRRYKTQKKCAIIRISLVTAHYTRENLQSCHSEGVWAGCNSFVKYSIMTSTRIVNFVYEIRKRTVGPWSKEIASFCSDVCRRLHTPISELQKTWQPMKDRLMPSSRCCARHTHTHNTHMAKTHAQKSYHVESTGTSKLQAKNTKIHEATIITTVHNENIGKRSLALH